jgi:hypothetical protein
MLTVADPAVVLYALQDPGTLQLLHSFFAAAHDIFYISFGRWHSNNCDGVDASYSDALERLGAYLQV